MRNARQLWLPFHVVQAGERRWNCPRCVGGVIGKHGNGVRQCFDCWHEWKLKGD